jgi:hypothetical protein
MPCSTFTNACRTWRALGAAAGNDWEHIPVDVNEPTDHSCHDPGYQKCPYGRIRPAVLSGVSTVEDLEKDHQDTKRHEGCWETSLVSEDLVINNDIVIQVA